MEVNVQEFIELEDCSILAIKNRYKAVRRALN